MAKYHLHNLFKFRFWFNNTMLQICSDLLKYPRITSCCSSNHYTVTSCLCKHSPCIYWFCNITTSYNRDGYSFLYLTNYFPICLTTIKLISCPCMHSYSRCTIMLSNLRYLHSIYIVLGKTFTDFYSYWLSCCFCYFIYYVRHQSRFTHKGRSLPIINNLWNRTTHINIKNIVANIIYLLYGI